MVRWQRWQRKNTDLLPSKFCYVFEIDATCETDCAIWGIVEDECEEVSEKTGLSGELVELLFGLFSRCWLKGSTEEGCDV